MAKNAKVSNGTLHIDMGKKRPKVIGNIKEIKAAKVIKRPKVIWNIEEPKANRAIKIPN